MYRTFFHAVSGIFSASRNISAVLHDNFNSVNIGGRRLGRRFAAFALIAGLLLPGFFAGPVQRAKAGATSEVTVPVSAPPEPFVVEGSGFKVLGLELTQRLASKAAALFASFVPSSKKANPELSTLNSPLEPPPPAGNINYDFDVDGRADIGRWKSGSTEFKIKNSSNGSYVTTTIGTSASKPAPGDFDGDGRTDAAVFNAGTWNIKRSSDGVTQNVSWGAAGDVPVSGDYDGDGKTDAAVFRPSTNTWWILQSSNGSYTATSYGAAGDVPVAGNYYGDSRTDMAVFRPSNGTWYVQGTGGGGLVLQWGLSTDTPVHGDFDGDGKDDPAIFRASSGDWYVLKSLTGYSTWINQVWGNYGDQPVPADYDGDGKTDRKSVV